MATKLTIHVSRVNAMRIVAKAIREKTQRFNKDKNAMPRNIERYRKELIAALKDHMRVARTVKTLDAIEKLAGTDIIDWQKRRDWEVKRPELNVCTLQNYLVALQNDVRKEITIGMGSELWSLLQADKCEVIRG